jgi:hypothetical protein
MVGIAAGFALALAVSCLSIRCGAVFHAPGPSSSMRFPASPRAWVLSAKLMVVAWYSPSYKSEKEEDDEEEGLWGGGGWGRRDHEVAFYHSSPPSRPAMLCFKHFKLMFPVFYRDVAKIDHGMLHMLQ